MHARYEMMLGVHPGYRSYPAPRKRSYGLIVALVAGGVFVLLCAACGLTAFSGQGGDKALTGGAKIGGAAGAAGRLLAGLNTPVRDGKFEFVVSSLACGQETVGDQEAQGQFCVARLSVKNIGTAPQTFLVDNQKAITSSGAVCSADSSATLALAGGQSTWISDINPGNAISGPIVFDVATGATVVRLVLHDSMLSSGVSVRTT